MNNTRGRIKFNNYLWLFKIIESFIKCFPYKLRLNLFYKLRMKQGNIGLGLRYVFLKSISMRIGENVSIHPNVYIYNPDQLIIGNNVSIHPMSYIEAKGGITIGNDVSIAHAVTILSVNHNFENKDIPIKNQGIHCSSTTIMNNVWVGAKVSVLAGVNIETGTIIATGAVVTKNTNPFSTVAGIPAKEKKIR